MLGTTGLIGMSNHWFANGEATQVAWGKVDGEKFAKALKEGLEGLPRDNAPSLKDNKRDIVHSLKKFSLAEMDMASRSLKTGYDPDVIRFFKERVVGNMKAFLPESPQKEDLVKLAEALYYLSIDQTMFGCRGARAVFYEAYEYIVDRLSMVSAAAIGLNSISQVRIRSFLKSIKSEEELDVFNLKDVLLRWAKGLDGNSKNLSELERDCVDLVLYALTPKNYCMKNLKEPDIVNNAAIFLLGIYQHLKQRAPAKQTVYVELDEAPFDPSGIMEDKRGLTDAVKARMGEAIRQKIRDKVKEIYSAFAPDLSVVFERPKEGDYSVVYVANSAESVHQYFKSNPELFHRSCNNLFANSILHNDKAVAIVKSILDRIQYNHRGETCSDSPEFADELLSQQGLMWFLMKGAAGVSHRTDIGNIDPADKAVVYSLAKYQPQKIHFDLKNYPDQAKQIGGTYLSTTLPSYYSDSKEHHIASIDDSEGIESIGITIGETVAHEIGHLLGFLHVPWLLMDVEPPYLMSGDERKPHRTETDARRGMLSPTNQLMLRFNYKKY